MTRFDGKSSWWFIVLIFLFIALMVVFMVLPSPIAFWCGVVGLLLPAYLISTLVRNHVDLYDDRIEICYGPMTSRIPLKNIRLVERTHCALAGFANSLDRVLIATCGREGFDDQLVSLKDNDAFIQQIGARLRSPRVARDAGDKPRSPADTVSN